MNESHENIDTFTNMEEWLKKNEKADKMLRTLLNSGGITCSAEYFFETIKTQEHAEEVVAMVKDLIEDEEKNGTNLPKRKIVCKDISKFIDSL